MPSVAACDGLRSWSFTSWFQSADWKGRSRTSGGFFILDAIGYLPALRAAMPLKSDATWLPV